MRFSRHCFGFQSRRFSLLMGYNIEPSSSSTNKSKLLVWKEGFRDNPKPEGIIVFLCNILVIYFPQI